MLPGLPYNMVAGCKGEFPGKGRELVSGSHMTYDLASEVTQHQLCHILFIDTTTKSCPPPDGETVKF